MRRRLTFEELISDPDFKEWVIHPTVKSDGYWNGLLEENTDVAKARDFLKALHEAPEHLSAARKEQMWEQIKKTAGVIRGTQVLSINDQVRYRKDKSGLWGKLLVACIFLALILSLAITSFYKEKAPVTTYHQIIKENPSGQKLKLHLPDGSVVFLNSASTLIYDSRFAEDHRVLKLQGEAYFDVAHSPENPFTVKTGTVSTTAVGTAFNVRARENAVSVFLVKGKVKVREANTRTSSFLTEREKISFSPGKGFSGITKVSNLNEILWKDGILIFENTPIEEVVKVLENWYGVQVQVVGDPGDLTFSGRYDNEYLSNVLESLGFATDCRYKIEGDNVKLKFR